MQASETRLNYRYPSLTLSRVKAPKRNQNPQKATKKENYCLKNENFTENTVDRLSQDDPYTIVVVES